MRQQICDLLVSAEKYASQLGCKSPTSSGSPLDQSGNMDSDALNCLHRIQFIFPEFAQWQFRLLLTLHYQRKILLVLLRMDRKHLKPTLTGTLERTITQAENSFLTISKLVKTKIDITNLTPLQHELLDQCFFKIPFDEAPLYIDSPTSGTGCF